MSDMLQKPAHQQDAGQSEQAMTGPGIGLGTLNHFGVAVRDLERSIAFYRALTGREPAARGVWAGDDLGKAAGVDGRAQITWALFRLSNANIDLLQVDAPQSPAASYQLGQPGAMHACFEVDDLAAVFERMEAAGFRFHGPWHRVTKTGDGAELGEGVVLAYFDGPDGEHLELNQSAPPFVREGQG